MTVQVLRVCVQVAQTTVRREIRLSWVARGPGEALGVGAKVSGRAALWPEEGREAHIAPSGHWSTFSGKPTCSGSVIQTRCALKRSTLDRAGFSPLPCSAWRRQDGRARGSPADSLLESDLLLGQGPRSLAAGRCPHSPALPFSRCHQRMHRQAC